MAFSRAGEWMLDNFYVVKQTLHQIEVDLPKKYYAQLPKLGDTALKGYPRIFGVARGWVEQNECQLDMTAAADFMQAYQQSAPLTIGELWALPTMFRIGILESLSVAVASIAGVSATEEFNAPPLAPFTWMSPREKIVANCFLSLRLLAATDWKAFFEQTSRVEAIICAEPAGIYAGMDFDTRNNYRSVIEELARHSPHSEESVAQIAIGFCNPQNNSPRRRGDTEENKKNSAPPRLSGSKGFQRQSHIGYYLIDAGRATLEKELNYKPRINIRLRNWFLARPTFTYLGSIALAALIIFFGLMTYAYLSGGTLAQLVLVGILGLGLSVEAAIILRHWEFTHKIAPRSLPRMDFSKGVPAEYRTMVVVPTLLGNAKELDGLLQELEIYFLSNPDPQLTFALLTDFHDAPAQIMDADEALLALAKIGVENLNKKYAGGQAKPFYLFHRAREWNPSEKTWMGWERKRGKLSEFNKLLLGEGETSCAVQIGDLNILRDIKYVITLDADTSLPHGSARRLIATLAHPLNRAEFSADGRTVVAGYTVLQPRVAIKPTSANRSVFSQIYAGVAGFDLYALAVSDVYQDLFGEGSYVGKGIYDVAAFEQSLRGQIRENTLLSHDLFEGIYGRAALVTDIILYEEYPSRYLVYARRMHRWIRGDWQLLPWLSPVVRTETGSAPNRLTLINLWKVFDNLRRSLLAPTTLATFIAGWLFFPASPFVWTFLVLFPSLAPILTQVFQNIKHEGAKEYEGKPFTPLTFVTFVSFVFKNLLTSAKPPLTRWTFVFLFLPYEAFISLDAIARTLVRLFTRRSLLQWVTAVQAQTVLKTSEVYGWKISSALFSALLGGAIFEINPPALIVALPFLIAWIAAPHIAHWMSQPITRVAAPLSESQHKQIQRLARRTWTFFEQFVGPDDHWLPPDHFQEAPRGYVAHLTTPTNIGLFLSSVLSAYDFGYISLLDLVLRLRSTFESMEALEHYRGHLFNWYDTQTMATLQPRYVSTVDSGNLAACLISLRQGLLSLKHESILNKKQWQGLLVVIDILKTVLRELEKNNPESTAELFEIELDDIYARIIAIENKPAKWTEIIEWLSSEGWETVTKQLMEMLESHPNINSKALGELQLYLATMRRHLQSMQTNIELLAPWLMRLNDAPATLTESPAWKKFHDALPSELPSLENAAKVYENIREALSRFKVESQLDNEAAQAWIQQLDEDLSSAHIAVTPLLISFNDLAEQANEFVNAMDFRFLFSERRKVFHIGYNAQAEKLDSSYYDLLASEARIASLIAIAKGDAPQSHWLYLGRPVTMVNGKQTLLSWSGTMFEYLMPILFVKNYEGTFLYESCHVALDAHIDYGREKNVPWGISESGYYAFDTNMNYQYHAFGAPDLGYKRDLSNDLVIAPYASLLGLPLQPQAVMNNFTRLKDLNMLGRFGLYESLDYTKPRLPAGRKHEVVQSYMAHHQGMILLSICNATLDNVMVKRFHADERIRSVELLLQEKIPQNPYIERPHPSEPAASLPQARTVDVSPWRVPVDSPTPQAHVLSQGDYSLLITNAGGGFSQWREFALTRWQADSTLDDWGTWIYIQDRETDALWSVACQPIGCPPEKVEVFFSPHQVEFKRWNNGVSLRTEITVSATGVEIRRVTILNDGDEPRKLKLISYGEVVLAPQAADRRHPAFNKLFIESEYDANSNALIFQRRPRSADEKPVVMAHALVVEAWQKISGEYESNRVKFLGRSQTSRSPEVLRARTRITRISRMLTEKSLKKSVFVRAIRPIRAPKRFKKYSPSHLSNTVGGTLDPIFSLAQEIDLKPHAKTRVTFLTAAAETRAAALELIAQHKSAQEINHAFNEARAHNERELIDAGLNSYGVEHIQRLLSALIYPAKNLRVEPHVLAQNEKGQAGLWAHGISGDLPIMLVRVRNGESPLLLEALQAHAYWRARHIKINIVILNDQDTGYALDLHNAIQRQIARMNVGALLNQRDGIFIIRTDQLNSADRILLQSAAGVILDENNGSLAEHANRLMKNVIHLPKFTPSLSSGVDSESTPSVARPADLLMDNGFGGFSADGKEYVIYLEPNQHTPRPWINVIANSQFGFLVSESGLGCSWAENSGENKITPWRNDPLTDMPSEAIYLRDEETGAVWSPTPMPAGADANYLIRHGAGYSEFESQSHGLNQRLRLFAATDAPVKIARLRLENLWERPRRVTVTYYAEWVLGAAREINQAHVAPEFLFDKHALLASNRFNTEFGERVAFLAANKKPHSVTTDRAEFLGRLGSMQTPSALWRIGLASAVNAGLDPCAAIQLHIDLEAGASEEVFFLLGEGKNRDETLEIINRFQTEGQTDAAWDAVNHLWDETLGAITVQTPDVGMNLLLNRWMLYQTLACRLWGRTALYQSSGAFGFRDQLQDSLALFDSRPDLARAQILNAAAHQFDAGDVLHWWNPPSGRGVRTRFSDDLLWLPYVTAEYVSATGDVSILDEQIPFLKGDALKATEAERYAFYETTRETGTLYEHCRRAIEKGTTFGVHDLPLMGSGDWNDGMNLVGIEGRGESVWLGWFLHSALTRFAGLCEMMKNNSPLRHGDAEDDKEKDSAPQRLSGSSSLTDDNPEYYLQHAKRIAAALDAHAWDGDWYLRAFYDDGSRLGSHVNNECRIDSIAQSWSVLSGAGDAARAAQAMESVYQVLVRQDEKMILLFTPPFDKTERDPGYIKGYLPGVRENGGQYTHGAIWTARAFAELGQGDRAEELFRMLNPIYHADTPEKMAHHKAEPYVIAADIYSVAPHVGVGGWTWYTGSAGWMYQLGIKSILGIVREGNALKINPCIPKHWQGFTADYRFGATHYQIEVKNPHGVNRGVVEVLLDGAAVDAVQLVDDGRRRMVAVEMGKADS